MKHKRKARNYLLQPAVQLRYVYYFLGVVIAPLSVMLMYSSFSFIELRHEIELAAPASDSILSLVDATIYRVSVAFTICLLFTAVATILTMIIVSHRFVGPAYVINRHLQAMKAGNFTIDRDLRKADELRETLNLLKDLALELSKKESNRESKG